MEIHYTFHHELIKLNKKILKLGTMVEDRVRRATSIIHKYDEEIAEELKMTDYEIDEMEMEIEEDCLKILALYHPVASDLRFIISVIKINNEIERVADIAVNIAQRMQTISRGCNGLPIIFDYSSMADKAILMLKMSLDSLVNRDSALARRIFLIDDEVDALRNAAYSTVKQAFLKNSGGDPGCLINTYLLARHLERIGDRATNIAEEVIYLVEGSMVRCP
jgi:phosphate transport system protein